LLQPPIIFLSFLVYIEYQKEKDISRYYFSPIL
jgi:hypothetical protein